MKPAFFPRSAATLFACVTVLGCDPELDLPENPGSNVSLRTELLEVPSNDLDPASSRISLDYSIYRSVDVRDGERRAPRGVLAFHFGGPGNDNIRSFSGFLGFVDEQILAGLVENYVVVALNEVGVSTGEASGTLGSVALDCNQRYEPVGQDLDGLLAEAEELATACSDELALLDQINSARAARDLERLRIQLGYDQMSIYSFAEGASVALAYAAQFPTSTGRIILDSPTDPSRALLDRVNDRATNLEASIDRFLNWCDDAGDDSCPFGDGDATGELSAWLGELPDNAAGTQPSKALLIRTIIDRLELELSWPTLGFRLAELRAGNIDYPSPADPPDVFYAFSCNDAASISAAELESFRTDLLAAAPRVGPLLAGEPFPCSSWPTSPERIDWAAELPQAPPLLITHNALDPQAPASWVTALRASIPASVVVRTPEASHRTGLQALNECQDAALAAHLFEDELPSADVECEAGPTSVLF